MEDKYDILSRMTGIHRNKVKKSIEDIFNDEQKSLSEQLSELIAKATTADQKSPDRYAYSRRMIPSIPYQSVMGPPGLYEMRNQKKPVEPSNASTPQQTINNDAQNNAIRNLSVLTGTIPIKTEPPSEDADGPMRDDIAEVDNYNRAAASALYGRNSAAAAAGKPPVNQVVLGQPYEMTAPNIAEEEEKPPGVDDTDDTQTRKKMLSALYGAHTALGWNPETINEYNNDPHNPKWNQYTTYRPHSSDDESGRGGPPLSIRESDNRVEQYLDNNSGAKKYNPVTGQWERVQRSMFPATFKKSFFFLNSSEE